MNVKFIKKAILTLHIIFTFTFLKLKQSTLEDIEIINKVGLELLDEKEQIVALYRLKYKDVSLLELSEIIPMETGKKITKSGIYHRFKKISELADKLKEKM